jgi:hypothetical protein
MQNPNEGRRLLAVSFAELGMLEEARKEAAEILKETPSFSVDVWKERIPYVDPALNDKFAEGLRRAGLPN